MRKLLASAALSLLIGVTPAAAATVNLAAPSGTVYMIQDGSGNNLSLGGICGAAIATLETNCAFQWWINSAGQGLVLASAPLGGFVSGSIADLYSATAPTPYAGSGVATAITELDAIRQNTGGPIPSGTNPLGYLIAGTTGGWSKTRTISVANTTAVVIKSSPGMVAGLQGGNIASTPAYVKLYDAASGITCGSGTPAMEFIIPANTTAADGAGTNPPIPAPGVTFTSGITQCITMGIADGDTTAPTANTVIVNLNWE